MIIEINIGMNVNGVKTLSTAEICKTVEDYGFEIFSLWIVQSDSEPTVVFATEIDESKEKWKSDLFDVALALCQECIAVFDPESGNGELIGPRAEKWGEFNPHYFFRLDGSRAG